MTNTFRKCTRNNAHKALNPGLRFIRDFSMRLPILLFVFTMSLHATALEFKIVDIDEGRIRATGEIVPGDLDRFRTFFEASRCGNRALGCTLSLTSPGGSLMEGIRLGLYFHEKYITTLVEKGNYCYSSCAVAFLGGTMFRPLFFGPGPKKLLEVGASLGFHSYSAYPEFSNRRIVLSEAIEGERVLRGIILEYARRVLVPNIELLYDITTVTPKELYLVSTMRDIKGLGITLRGELPQRTSGWWNTVCEKSVASRQTVYEREKYGTGGRLSKDSKGTQMKPSELRDALVNLFYSSQSRSCKFREATLSEGARLMCKNNEMRLSEVSQLSASVFLHLLLGVVPEFPVYRMYLERGAGFYYDYCYAFDAGYRIITILASREVGGRGSFELIEYNADHGWVPDNLPLW